MHKKLLPKTADFCAIFLLTKYVVYDIIITEVKKRITNEIENNLKNFKKSVDKHKQRCYNKHIIKKGKSKRLKGKKL